jgi:hypothetical protein
MRTGKALALARLAVGAAAGLEAFAVAPLLRLSSDPLILRMPIVPFLPRLTGAAVPIFVVIWAGAALAFVVGMARRVSGAILLVALGYVLLLDQQTYSNHTYLLFLVTALLTFVAHSPDAAWLLKTQITIVYLFAALSKINPAFISGLVIAGALKPAAATFGVPAAWRGPEALVPAALATIATEVFLARGLWSARWRRTAAILGIGLHGGTVLLMANVQPLAVFGVTCVALYPLFFAQDEPTTTS